MHTIYYLNYIYVNEIMFQYNVMNSYEIITHILLLQKASKYPEAHPLSQCPLIELQETLCKQFPLQ